MLFIAWNDGMRTDVDRRRTVGAADVCDTTLDGLAPVTLVVEALSGYALVEDVSGSGLLLLDGVPVVGRRALGDGARITVGDHEGVLTTATVEAATDGIITQRQLECIACLADGRTLDETAAIIGVTHSTISSHLQQAYRRLGVANRKEAVAVAFARGLFPDRRRGHAAGGLYAWVTGASTTATEVDRAA